MHSSTVWGAERILRGSVWLTGNPETVSIGENMESRLYKARFEAREIANRGRSKAKAMDKDSKSLHQYRQRSGSGGRRRVDQEALAVAGDGILE